MDHQLAENSSVRRLAGDNNIRKLDRKLDVGTIVELNSGSLKVDRSNHQLKTSVTTLESLSFDHIYVNNHDDDYDEDESNKDNKIKCHKFFCTMDMFSMIKNTIVSEDSNPILRFFELGRQVGSYGPEMGWKIYDAIRIEDKKVRTSKLIL